tara:strand:- start:89 stop:316 length:228 start_codon:yes stop_codon:yes gene_type:complete
MTQTNQPQLFETEDQYGNDIIQGPKIIKRKLTTKETIIDPKNPGTVGTSAWNLGNHTLAICFILCIIFVVYASYK